MNIFLWILQGFLAGMFFITGSMKLMQKKEVVLERMIEQLSWVKDFTQQQLYAIGVLEILGAAGLILPGLIGILPSLVPSAALGLAMILVGAALTHRRLGETSMLIGTLLLALVSLFVAYGRFAVVPL